jgi:hypothetical protein
MFKDVVKATVFHAFWNMLTEAQREEAVQKAIKEVEEKGKFVEPPPEVLAQKILSEKQEAKP